MYFFVIFLAISRGKIAAFEMAKSLIQILEDIMNKHPSKFRLVKSPKKLMRYAGYGMENGAN